MPEIALIELAGRVLLSDGTERDCRVRFDDADRIELVLDVPPRPGAPILCQIDGLGAIEGYLGEEMALGRRLDVRATPSHTVRLASRMAWHRRMATGQEDRRVHDRIGLPAAEVRVRSESGSEVVGTLIDLSATGAAIRLSSMPEIGAKVVVGRRRATVVRHLDDGVAVRFQLPLRPQDVAPDVVL